MQLLLSPAKLLDFSQETKSEKGTDPIFVEKTDQLSDFCQQMSVEEVSQILNINKKMAHDAYGYFQSFHLNQTPVRSAAFAFNGIAYKGLNIHDFSDDELSFAQKHLNILSGMYGLLRPLDVIKPYRLDMGTRLSPTDDSLNESGNLNTTYPKSNYLYGYWQETVNKYLHDRLKKDDNAIINLSSAEYFKLIVPKLLPDNMRMVTIVFKEQKEKGLKQIVVYAKKARGLMARFIIKNKITDLEEIKGFDTDGYFYSPAHSTPNEWTFVR